MDMQARRNAYRYFTETRPPAEPKRWLVVWEKVETDGERWKVPMEFDYGMDAEHARQQFAKRGINAKAHDLDAWQ